MDTRTGLRADPDDPRFAELLESIAQESSHVLRRLRLDAALSEMAAADPAREAAVRPVLEDYLRSIDAAWESTERKLREADPSGAMRRDFVARVRRTPPGSRPLDG